MNLKNINQSNAEANGKEDINCTDSKTIDDCINTLLSGLATGLIPQPQETSTDVDEVLEFATFTALPTTGQAGKIYVVLDTNTIYRWSGSGYAALSTGSGVQSIGGQTGVVTFVQLGLDKVNNTSDLDKPISTATLVALAGKADIDDARLTGLDRLVNSKAVRISTDAARTRTYYTGFATAENTSAIDGVVQALRDATPGETVQVTTPLVFPYADRHAAVLQLPAGITLDLSGFSLTSTQRQDGIGFTATGNYIIYGGDATIYSTGAGSCGFTWPATVVPIIRAYDVHMENTGTASSALVRSGSVFHRGSIIVKSATGANLYSNGARYELVGDVTVYNNATGFEVATGCAGLVRQGRYVVADATACAATIYDGGKFELMQCVVDLTAGPTTAGVRLQTATSTLILTDVTVLAGSIVAGTISPGQLILRGSTTLPAAYEAAYLRALGIIVTDERFAPGASGNIQAKATGCLCVATGSGENHPANQFATIAITNVLLDQKPSGTNGGFDAGTHEYTAPVSGIYQATSKLRIAGNAVKSNQSYGQGVGLLNEDGTWFLWSLATNSFINSLNQRLLHLNAGEKIRMYAFFDQFTAGYSAEINIVLLDADSKN